jgi:hypothetical protein
MEPKRGRPTWLCPEIATSPLAGGDYRGTHSRRRHLRAEEDTSAMLPLKVAAQRTSTGPTTTCGVSVGSSSCERVEKDKIATSTLEGGETRRDVTDEAGIDWKEQRMVKQTEYGIFAQACWDHHKRQHPDELIHKEIEEFNQQSGIDWWKDFTEKEQETFQDQGRNSPNFKNNS